MLQFEGELGERVLLRLKSELVIWLTTVSKDGTPQPNPVWFLWDGETCLIYSQPESVKVHNIMHRPMVSLHFEGASGGDDDVIVLTGEAHVIQHPVPIPQEYRQKYEKALRKINFTWEKMEQEYSAAITFRPVKYRGF
jgi:PPOX class probable F420-dependent enzyme